MCEKGRGGGGWEGKNVVEERNNEWIFGSSQLFTLHLFYMPPEQKYVCTMSLFNQKTWETEENSILFCIHTPYILSNGMHNSIIVQTTSYAILWIFLLLFLKMKREIRDMRRKMSECKVHSFSLKWDYYVCPSYWLGLVIFWWSWSWWWWSQWYLLYVTSSQNF